MKTILITGGAGFIGSNLVRYLLKRHPDYYIINADLLTYAGSLANLAGIEGNERHTFVRADVRSRDDMEAVFARGPIDAVIHLAAHSHVDRSIDTPGEFLLTNVVGTQVVLDCAKRYWSLRPDDRYCREYRRGVRFLQVSTDEVYGTLGGTGRFTESSPLAPNSPYSASKASADLMVRAYHETYGLPALITRCANNYGPYQFPEKLIPLMIRRGLQEQPLPVYGDGLQRREWLHVSDHCAALDAVLQGGVCGEVYNIGGGEDGEIANLELVRLIAHTLNKPESLITHVADRPGHDRRYALDCTKLTSGLGWSPKVEFVQGMRETIAWYVRHTDWMEGVLPSLLTL